MAYVDVSKDVLTKLADQLTSGTLNLAKMVDLFNSGTEDPRPFLRVLIHYRFARSKWKSYQDGYQSAFKEYGEATRALSDELIKLQRSIDEVENHSKGMDW